MVSLVDLATREILSTFELTEDHVELAWASGDRLLQSRADAGREATCVWQAQDPRTPSFLFCHPRGTRLGSTVEGWSARGDGHQGVLVTRLETPTEPSVDLALAGGGAFGRLELEGTTVRSASMNVVRSWEATATGLVAEQELVRMERPVELVTFMTDQGSRTRWVQSHAGETGWGYAMLGTPQGQTTALLADPASAWWDLMHQAGPRFVDGDGRAWVLAYNPLPRMVEVPLNALPLSLALPYGLGAGDLFPLPQALMPDHDPVSGNAFWGNDVDGGFFAWTPIRNPAQSPPAWGTISVAWALPGRLIDVAAGGSNSAVLWSDGGAARVGFSLPAIDTQPWALLAEVPVSPMVNRLLGVSTRGAWVATSNAIQWAPADGSAPSPLQDITALGFTPQWALDLGNDRVALSNEAHVAVVTMACGN